MRGFAAIAEIWSNDPQSLPIRASANETRKRWNTFDMKRVTRNPVPAVESMLDSCRGDEVKFFFINHARGKDICVYPTSEDELAATKALVIPNAGDAFVLASVIGLVRLHNLRFEDQTQAAVAAFVRTCTADFYFGYGFGEET
jgi:hypothetical protein